MNRQYPQDNNNKNFKVLLSMTPQNRFDIDIELPIALHLLRLAHLLQPFNYTTKLIKD